MTYIPNRQCYQHMLVPGANITMDIHNQIPGVTHGTWNKGQRDTQFHYMDVGTIDYLIKLHLIWKSLLKTMAFTLSEHDENCRRSLSRPEKNYLRRPG